MFYGCEGYPECDFMSWQRPSDKKCPKCGGIMLIKGNKLVCANEECGYILDTAKCVVLLFDLVIYVWRGVKNDAL